MAAITPTVANVSGAFTVTVTAGTGTDTFSYVQGGNQLMVMENTTGSPVTATFHGSATQLVTVPGYGTVDPSAGLAVTVPANGIKAVKLQTIYAYLGGNASITGTTGLNLSLYNM